VRQTVQKVENAGGEVVEAVTKGVDAAKMKALRKASAAAARGGLQA
jgi:hypothetical protein